MRPASEIHSALDLLDSELARKPNAQYQIARDALAWAVGGHAPHDGPTLWLVTFLLGDPPQIDPTPPGAN